MKTYMKVKLIAHTPNAEELIATAAKLCYSSMDIAQISDGLSGSQIKKSIQMLMDMGHESPVEHVTFTFGIEGVSRSLTHQLVRHRHASYSQKSQRYVNELEFEYVIPPNIENNKTAKAVFLENMRYSQNTYDLIIETLLDDKLDRFKGFITKEVFSKFEKEAMEDARYVLPNACETKIICTMNARELLHFFEQRCCNRAQWEIRELATKMLTIVQGLAPTVFASAGPRCLTAPCPEGGMSCGKIRSVRSKFRKENIHRDNGVKCVSGILDDGVKHV